LDQPFNKNKINFENIFGFLYIYTHQDFPGEVAFDELLKCCWLANVFNIFYSGRIIDWHTK